jgi:predicted nucleotidyltransferase
MRNDTSGSRSNDANLEHVLEILRQRAATEESGRRLTEAARQKLAELNAHRHYEAFARQHVSRAEIETSRERLEARGQRRRQAPATSAAMLHCQMREAREEKRARTQAAMAKNDDEAGPPSAPTDD